MCRFQTLTGKNRRNQSRARSNNKVPHCKQDYKQRRENIKTECTNRGEWPRQEWLLRNPAAGGELRTPVFGVEATRAGREGAVAPKGRSNLRLRQCDDKREQRFRFLSECDRPNVGK